MYSKKTRKINITVNPYFLDDQSEPEEQHFVWAYQVTIDNQGNEKVQLKNRYWKIIDSNGSEQEEISKTIEQEVEEDDTPKVIIVTENQKKEVMQIIYFDFDNSRLSEVSKNTLFNFLDKNKNQLSRYIIFGHTDTKGTNQYNMELSINRAESVKQALLDHGIIPDAISILGKGENELAIDTPDDTKHPVNRRAEVKILN